MIELKKLSEENMIELYNIIYTSTHPAWSDYNAPYLNDYEYINLETFMLKNNHSFYLSERVRGIFYNNKLIGIVTKQWQSFATRWLEVGIIIYSDKLWSQGLGAKSLTMWFEECFNDHPEIMHLGLTTWSGNIAMMKLSEKIGLNLEAHIKKVRYYNGVYYDCLKYGILREDFFTTHNNTKTL